MANSGDKLTKYKNAVTIITADAANSWYGGLYGSPEGSGLAATNPLVAGHAHDGQHLDGHAQKIDLVDHVTNKLRNANIETAAVNKRTVSKLANQGDAIPEYEIIGGTPYYYLDLSVIRSELAGGASFEYDSINDVIRQSEIGGSSYSSSDFLFGATSLNYDSTNASRFFFDKSKGAFRAGSAPSVAWNTSNVGNYSAAFGLNTGAAGIGSFVTGSTNGVGAASDYSSVLGGSSNLIVGARSIIGNGLSNSLTAPKSIIGGGESNTIDSASVSAQYTAIVGGYNSTIQSSPYSFIGGGKGHFITTSDPASESSFNVIVGGGHTGALSYNLIQGTGPVASFIGAGSNNQINVSKDSGTNGLTITGSSTAVQTRHAIVGGKENVISATSNFGEYGFIGTGLSNSINSSNDSWSSCTILNGINNELNGSTFNQIINGFDNTISGAAATKSSILNGQENQITSSVYSTILSGGSNTVTNDHVTVISSSNVTADSYGAVYHGASDGDTNYVATMIFSGNLANDLTNYYLFLNGLNNQILITAVGSERFKINYGGTGITEGTAVTFIGEYTCVGDVAATSTIYAGRVSRAAYVTTGGVLTWTPVGGTSHLSISTVDFVGGVGGTIEYANTSNEVAILVNMPANHTNFSWTFSVKAIFAKT